MSGLRIAGVSASAAAMAMAAAIALDASGSPGGAARCGQAGTALEIHLRGERHARLALGAGGTLRLDGRTCDPHLSELSRIEVRAGRGGQTLVVDPGPDGFGQVAVVVDLGPGKDRTVLLGMAVGERHAVGRRLIDLDPATGDGMLLTGIERLAISGAGGADVLSAGGWRGPLALAGGSGDDELAGARRRDRLRGGRGRDHLAGGAAGDRIDGGAGDDRCLGGGGRDALLSCMAPFDGRAKRLGPHLRRRMTGGSWHRGCPVALGRLRLLQISHWTMSDRDVHRGRLVVHRDAARDVLQAMRSLFADRFPIRRMNLIDRYSGDDHRSMNADNTSAFNCRFVAGTTQWSQHAFGRAIDINPIENPYVTGSGHVSPPAGRRFRHRSRNAPGMIHAGDAVVRAFARVGWGWGGSWSGTRDYQHFSATGR